jgi:hypothetical protein
MGIALTSSAFEDGGYLPRWYTREEINASPPLGWTKPPLGTRSLAVVCNSRRGKGDIFYHWLVYNISPERRSIDGKQPSSERILGSVRQARNSLGGLGWGGPADISEKLTLRLRLFCLDQMIDPSAGPEALSLVRAMDGHVIADATLLVRNGPREEAEEVQKEG